MLGSVGDVLRGCDWPPWMSTSVLLVFCSAAAVLMRAWQRKPALIIGISQFAKRRAATDVARRDAAQLTIVCRTGAKGGTKDRRGEKGVWVPTTENHDAPARISSLYIRN